MALSAAATRVARRAPLAKSMNKAVSARPVLARAEPTPEGSSAAPAEGKVYFGGKEYTEEQVRFDWVGASCGRARERKTEKELTVDFCVAVGGAAAFEAVVRRGLRQKPCSSSRHQPILTLPSPPHSSPPNLTNPTVVRRRRQRRDCSCHADRRPVGVVRRRR